MANNAGAALCTGVSGGFFGLGGGGGNGGFADLPRVAERGEWIDDDAADADRGNGAGGTHSSYCFREAEAPGMSSPMTRANLWEESRCPAKLYEELASVMAWGESFNKGELQNA